ncbi:MFS transporter [Desertibaculum subflavum]|uniref:MFS transporter n=1 Tax=Desertibaculum subflavum TaxID=2268458 RepID=UPI000E6766A8
MTVIDEAAGAVPASVLAGRREWIGLGVIALPCLLYSMDLTVLNLAVPHLSADLKPTSAELLWIVDIYGFLIAGLLITMGTLGDRIGRRKLLMIGAAAFGVASVLAAFATTPAMLIAARAILGVAGATLAPSTLSLIRNMFHDPGERTFAIGVWITSYSVGGAIGPLVGGVLLAHFWWGSVFLVAVPIMLLLLAVAPLLLPEYRDPQAGRMDLASAALSLAAVLAVIWGVKQVAVHGFTGEALLATAAGIALAAIFARRQRRLADPLIDLRLFRTPAFGAALVTNLLALFVAFGCFLLVAQYLQLVLGLTPLVAGLWTVPSSLGFVVGSMFAPMILRRFRVATVLVGGLCFAAAGFAVLAALGPQGDLVVLVGGTVVFALGLAPVVTLTTDLVVGAAPPERAGAASAMSETAAELGGALGIAVLGSIAAAIYRAQMAEAAGEGLPPAALATARDTLGGAYTIAAGLPGHLGAGLLTLAREAFVAALQSAVMISAAVVLAAALLVMLLLRNPRPAPAGP